MGKASNTSGLLEAVEENQNEVQNAKSIETGTLESKRTCQQQKRILENDESLKPNVTMHLSRIDKLITACRTHDFHPLETCAARRT